MKRFIQKITPRFIFNIYHYFLAFLGALIYGFPSRRMTIVGVTGTKGKTTICNLIAQIFEHCGFKVGLTTTVNFQIGHKKWINDKKQTMQGRFQLQKLLAQMVQAGCQYAIVETSSEGILQHRHRFIDYDVAVFTNLSPEHIEHHGSFAKYQAAKLKLFKKVARKKNGVGVYNLDSENVKYFLKEPIKRKWGYTLKKQESGIRNYESREKIEVIKVEKAKIERDGSSFVIRNTLFKIPLIGEFNVQNAVAAICVGLSQGIKLGKMKEALVQATSVPGRMEVIDEGQDFTVIIDYAHEPASLEAAYKALKLFKPKRIIALLGAQGGGRDKAKRPILGRLAAWFVDYIILTNEDPYDESPSKIIEEIEKGILSYTLHATSYKKILDRRVAIRGALNLAKPGDVVILTGKGGEKWMCVADGKKIPWDEAEIVRQELRADRLKL